MKKTRDNYICYLIYIMTYMWTYEY